MYRVHHDGSHYVAKKIEPKEKQFQNKEKHNLSDFEIDFREVYKCATMLGLSKKRELLPFIKDQLAAEWHDLPTFAERVEEELDRELMNLYNRKKRFRRKALLNEWNYFATFTYDSKMMSKDEFRKRFRRCLSNLHTRHGWRYMGVWEEGSRGGRLHFHALIYVPEGEMVGVLFDDEYYDKKSHSCKIAHRNTFFDRRFGRSDFKKISPQELRHGGAMGYLLKYIQKTGEKIVYSRGIPSELDLPLSEEDLVVKFVNYVDFFVVDPDCIWFDEDLEWVEPREMNIPLYYRC